ncbi:hypothetical protein AB0J52_21770, partial [Spirillospora sp. NPDC049652]
QAAGQDERYATPAASGPSDPGPDGGKGTPLGGNLLGPLTKLLNGLKPEQAPPAAPPAAPNGQGGYGAGQGAYGKGQGRPGRQGSNGGQGNYGGQGGYGEQGGYGDMYGSAARRATPSEGLAEAPAPLPLPLVGDVLKKLNGGSAPANLTMPNVARMRSAAS